MNLKKHPISIYKPSKLLYTPIYLLRIAKPPNGLYLKVHPKNWYSTPSIVSASKNGTLLFILPSSIFVCPLMLLRKLLMNLNCYVYRYIEPSYNTVVYTPLQVFVTIIIIFVHFSRDFWTFFCWLILMQHENYNFPLWYFYVFERLKSFSYVHEPL